MYRIRSVRFLCYICGKDFVNHTVEDHVKLPQASHEARICRYRR